MLLQEPYAPNLNLCMYVWAEIHEQCSTSDRKMLFQQKTGNSGEREVDLLQLWGGGVRFGILALDLEGGTLDLFVVHVLASFSALHITIYLQMFRAYSER